MKTSHHESLTMAMAKMLAEKVAEALATTRPDFVVPVPMHWWKRLMRGTNGPDLLAETIAARLRVPALPHLLGVRRRIRKQGTLLPGERFDNVRGVFRASSRYNVAAKHILLVDDVMTTGATANEATKTLLRRAGASRVSVAVIARGVGFDDLTT
jgi:ComF family protein